MARAPTADIRVDQLNPILGIATKSKSRRWQLERTKDALRAEFPEGVPPDLEHKEVLRRIEPFFKKNCWPATSVDTIARARNRRRG
jgi:hypothetical protein